VTGVRWSMRVGVGVLAVAAIEVACALLDIRVDHLRLALAVGLLVAAGSLVVDTVPPEPTGWPRARPEGLRAEGQDPRTASYLRLLEGHRTAREPDGALRDRLGDLADRVLSVRHDLTRDDPRGLALLGPDLQRVLAEPPRRLSVAEIEHLVSGIESL
jgi:hypothetical protein